MNQDNLQDETARKEEYKALISVCPDVRREICLDYLMSGALITYQQRQMKPQLASLNWTDVIKLWILLCLPSPALFCWHFITWHLFSQHSQKDETTSGWSSRRTGFVSSDVMVQRDFTPQTTIRGLFAASTQQQEPSLTVSDTSSLDHTMNLLTTRRDDVTQHFFCAITLLCKPQSSPTIINTHYVLASCDDDVRRVLNLIPRTRISRIVKANR